MDVRDIAQLDLNLLVHLHVLLEERHVSRAAARLRSSQPALSRSLARLRSHFDDPLLVRAGNTLVPTERAKALLPELEQILRGVEQLTHGTQFNPADARGTIRLSAPDVVALMLVPPLLQQLATRAPNLDLEVVQWQADWRPHLERGEIDLTVGFPKGDEPGLYATPLLEQDWAVVLRKGHPALLGKWTAEVFASLPHVLVTAAGRGTSIVDAALASHGLARRIHVRVPYPLLAPMLATHSDVVVTTVRFLALQLAQQSEVVVRKPPIPIEPVRVPMVWHERSHRDPRHRWFREQVVAAAASISSRMLRWPEKR